MTVDPSAAVVPILLSVAAFAALYVWTALALSAVFRKSGEEGWKAWVPVLNIVVLLRLGGFSGWFVLLALVPIAGQVALWVVVVIACYRVNVSFGLGVGMTVLAALLFPVWATVLGFGSARWIGAEQDAGVRRSTSDAGDGRAAFAPSEPGPPPMPAPAAATVNGWAPSSATPADDEVPPAPPLPPTAPSRVESPDEPISFVPLLPSAAPAAAPTAPPVPPLPSNEDVLAEPASPAPASRARANQGWGGFDLGAVGELTSEVTAAVAGAPSPISAVSYDDDLPDATGMPAVTRVPATRSATRREPWSPARSPLPEPDAFPEASGEVSAVLGAPVAGGPQAARSSVSAQHVHPHVPDGAVDQTRAANRRTTHWSVVLPTGSSVALVAEVVVVGRRPSPNEAYPNAQLIEVHDGTVSKTHLRLDLEGEMWSVTDLHSTNGTVLVSSDGSEREITPGVPHRTEDRLLLGDAELRLVPDDASR
ncbi:DUF5684 domain-containing protein [Microbacterium sp. SSM24]|uniref:DUF5684 domain-containing protein n=1 Tax=Microbacterium sp. SSM24 TaxID=2991714 RepID=UPI002225FC2C|nr:DUF5684 domain-containing protein [Microbacterium sp. SSM24]MCW3492377.1 DUF5684 domain-containing protein [Microbacterium sp. SSM24]